MQNLTKVKVPRLGRNRLGVFYVRYPSLLDERGRRKVVQQSLRTKDPATAKLLALRFCLYLAGGGAVSSSDPKEGVSPWTANIETGEFSASGEDDHRLLMGFLADNKDLLLQLQALKAKSQGSAPAAVVPASVLALPLSSTAPVQEQLSLQRAVELHLAAEAKTLNSEHTLHEKRVLFADFMTVFPAELWIGAISASQVATRWTPVEMARPNKKRKGEGLSLARLEKRRGYLLKFFTWAKASGFYVGDNPMQAKIATKKQVRESTESYAEFTADDLAAIFGRDYITLMDKPDWYWIPLLGLFSGARLSEPCNLLVADFEEVEGVKTYRIRKGKNKASQRLVPVHPTLLDLGLWDFVQALRARGAIHFVPHRPAKIRSKSVGREFGVLLDRCGIKDKSKVFHSFRSTAITDLYNAGANPAAVRKAVGHTSAAVSGAHGGYIRGQLLKALEEAIEKLQFPSIDFAKLRLADPTFKAFFDEEDAKAADPKLQERLRKRKAHEEARARRQAGLPLQRA
jgi:integrase